MKKQMLMEEKNRNEHSPFSHAYLLGNYYKVLRKHEPERLEEITTKIVKRNFSEMGSRIKNRAIKNGVDRTMGFVACSLSADITLDNVSECFTLPDGDFKVVIKGCPWHTVYKKLEVPQCGMIMCMHGDAEMARAFDGVYAIEPHNLIHKSDEDACVLYYRDANITDKNVKFMSEWDFEKHALQRPYTYHVAHLYNTIELVTREMLEEKADVILQETKDAFVREYSNEMLNEILALQDVDFLEA